MYSDYPQEQRKLEEARAIEILKREKDKAIDKCLRQSRHIASLESLRLRDATRTTAGEAFGFLVNTITSKIKTNARKIYNR